MEDYVIIYDTTLRDGEQAPGFRMNSKEKLEIAKVLEKLNVDIIEAGFPGSSIGDYESVNKIASEVKGPVISCLARCIETDIIAAGNALEPAIKRGKGKIHVFISTSDIHMDSKLKKTPEQVKEMAIAGVKKAKEFTDLIEFSCEDFARTNIDYTIEIVKAVVGAGATTINLPDTIGYRFPGEIEEMVSKVIRAVGKDNVIYSMHAHNDLGCATANTIHALKGGVRQVEVTINGIGERAGNTALEEIVAAVTERPDFFDGLKTRINTEMIIPVSKLVAEITGKNPQLNKSIVGGNAFKHSSGIHSDGILKKKETYEWIDPKRYGGRSEMPLTARSGSHQLKTILNKKGVKYNEDNLPQIMSRFKNMADKMDEVYDDSLIMAIRGDNAIPEYYKLISFKPWLDEAGGHAKIKVQVNGSIVEVIGQGNGMISATEQAMKKITKIPLNIINYSSKSISKGGASKGIQSIFVKNNGYTVRGIGIDDDTVMGAAIALIDASNKIRYVLEHQKHL